MSIYILKEGVMDGSDPLPLEVICGVVKIMQILQGRQYSRLMNNNIEYALHI